MCMCNPEYVMYVPVGKISCLCNKRSDQQVAATPQDSIKSTEEEERGQHAFKHSG